MTQTNPASMSDSPCETCRGKGTIDETLGGEPTSNPKTPCPDCSLPSLGTGSQLVPVEEACPKCGADEQYLRHRISALERTVATITAANAKLTAERDSHIQRLEAIRRRLEDAVCTEGIDKGIIFLSDDGPTHPETHGGKTIQVYDHLYFSPLGDALIEAWELTEPGAMEDREKLRSEWLEIVRRTLGLKEDEGVVDAIEALQAERDEAKATAERLTAERDKLQAFKDWVHNWLDKTGVPHDPDAEHNNKTGCRIGGRLEWLRQCCEVAERERDLLEGLFVSADSISAMPSSYAIHGTDARIRFDSDSRGNIGWRIVGQGKIHPTAIDAIRAALSPLDQPADGGKGEAQ